MKKQKLKKGDVFGKLTIIKEIENSTKTNKEYLCQCECGNTIIAQKNRLLNGKTTQCRCCAHKKDFTGQIVKGYKILKTTNERSGTNLKWLCQCVECHRTRIFSSDLISRGQLAKCRCKKIEEYIKKNNFQEYI